MTEVTSALSRLALVLILTCFAPAGAQTPASESVADGLAFWEELAFWESIENSTEPAEFEAYLQAYPDGRFAALARLRIESLGDGPAEAPNETVATDVLEPGAQFSDCDVCPAMVVVPAGRFTMGAAGRRPEEGPAHEVRFAEPFAIGVYELTAEEWDACVREAGCDYQPDAERDRRPISNLGWDDVRMYLRWLSDKTGQAYRLPSEAEWEYAASAGATSRFWWGDTIGTNRANCVDCGSPWGGKSPAPVGSFDANPFGLHDVHGNLWEWTLDCWNPSHEGAPSDGSARLSGNCLSRVLRGGCWNLDAGYMRLTRRYRYDRDVRYYLHGARVLRPLK